MTATVHAFKVPPKLVKGAHRGVAYELHYLPSNTDDAQKWQYIVTVYTPVIYQNNAATEQKCLKEAEKRIDELIDKGIVKGKR